MLPHSPKMCQVKRSGLGFILSSHRKQDLHMTVYSAAYQLQDPGAFVLIPDPQLPLLSNRDYKHLLVGKQ